MKPLKDYILEYVARVGDPLLQDIVRALADIAPKAVVEAEVTTLLHQGLLRMKDDDIDHDWTYRLTRKGDEYLGKERK